MNEIEVTPELTAAVGWLKGIVDGHKVVQGGVDGYSYAHTLLDALPEEVTNPKPELPGEPGHYEDGDGYAVTLRETGDWLSGSYGYTPEAMAKYGPFTRLVPEKPPVTGEEIFNLIDGSGPSYTTACEIAEYINNR